MRRENVSKAEPRDIRAGLSTIEERLAAQGRPLEEVVRRLKVQPIETPSWGYANSGTRFKVFPQPGELLAGFSLTRWKLSRSRGKTERES